MAERLVTVASFTNEAQAYLAKMRIEEEGIKCVVTGAISNMLIPFACPGVSLQVLESDAPRAIEILEAEPPEGDEEPEGSEEQEGNEEPEEEV